MVSLRIFRTTPRITQQLRFKSKKSAMNSNDSSKASKPLFNKDGAIGKQFQSDGAIGKAAQKVGGPLDKNGAIGKNFNADRLDSKIGKVVNDTIGKN